jgi:integrase
MAAEGRDVSGGPIFPNAKGGCVCKGNLRTRQFLPTLARAKLPLVRFHDLRHRCASLLLAAGVDCKVVSERLGHASTAFTSATYQHVLPGLQAQAAERLKTILAQVLPAKARKKKGK